MSRSGSEKVKMVAAYVRVSTWDQEKGLASQMRALKQYCDNHGWAKVKWYQDRITGASSSRPAFDKLQEDIFLGKVGTVVVWRLDRVSRKGIKEGLSILTDWLSKGVRVVSIMEQFDFTGAMGELAAAIFFAVARMGRDILIENTKRGMYHAKAKGVKLGKRSTLHAQDMVPLIQQGQTIAQVAERFDKTPQTIYNVLHREGIDLEDLRKGK